MRRVPDHSAARRLYGELDRGVLDRIEVLVEHPRHENHRRAHVVLVDVGEERVRIPAKMGIESQPPDKQTPETPMIVGRVFVSPTQTPPIGRIHSRGQNSPLEELVCREQDAVGFRIVYGQYGRARPSPGQDVPSFKDGEFLPGFRVLPGLPLQLHDRVSQPDGCRRGLKPVLKLVLFLVLNIDGKHLVEQRGFVASRGVNVEAAEGGQSAASLLHELVDVPERSAFQVLAGHVAQDEDIEREELEPVSGEPAFGVLDDVIRRLLFGLAGLVGCVAFFSRLAITVRFSFGRLGFAGLELVSLAQPFLSADSEEERRVNCGVHHQGILDVAVFPPRVSLDIQNPDAFGAYVHVHALIVVQRRRLILEGRDLHGEAFQARLLQDGLQDHLLCTAGPVEGEVPPALVLRLAVHRQSHADAPVRQAGVRNGRGDGQRIPGVHESRSFHSGETQVFVRRSANGNRHDGRSGRGEGPLLA